MKDNVPYNLGLLKQFHSMSKSKFILTIVQAEYRQNAPKRAVTTYNNILAAFVLSESDLKSSPSPYCRIYENILSNNPLPSYGRWVRIFHGWAYPFFLFCINSSITNETEPTAFKPIVTTLGLNEELSPKKFNIQLMKAKIPPTKKARNPYAL